MWTLEGFVFIPMYRAGTILFSALCTTYVYGYCWKMLKSPVDTHVDNTENSISHYFYAIILKSRKIQNPGTFPSQADKIRDTQPV